MTQTRESLGIMDGNAPVCDFSTKSERGLYLSKGLALVVLVIFALALVATAFLVYNFAACPRTDQLANATKLELLAGNSCGGPKLSVIPLTTEQTNSVVPVAGSTTYRTPVTSTPIGESEEQNLTVTNVRLPGNVRPEKYYLKLTPYIFEGNFTFDGEISIVIVAEFDTKTITFHGVDLTFHSIDVTRKETGKAIEVTNRTEDPVRQFHILRLAESLLLGERYVLNISYTGVLNDNLHGFYRSSYEEKNVTRWIAVTQFQATDARRAFPCWDEPALKARFTISLARPKTMTSISNMNAPGPPRQHETIPDYEWDEYAESLPMSTYLVAFAVTDFGRSADGNFAVWARREALPSAAYALEIGPKILRFLEDYYKIKFPLPKIDMIALPDFKAGAMENWGLLTFREIAMLYDPAVSPTTAKARVASVVAHEIAHQWFGNLVTPAWWSDIWLNEGFASYVEYVAVDAVEKSWKLMEVFVLNEIQSVFKLDALASSHQISVEVGNPEEIGAIFDKISYGKGSAILRMMNHFLTDEVFNAGITDYLNARKYGAAEQRDLWSALTTASRNHFAFDVDVGVVMDSWTLQTGFPVLTVIRDYKANVVHFEQERFVLLNDTKSNEKPLWWIPISYTTAGERNFTSTRPGLWMRGVRSYVADLKLGADQWLVVNIQQTGFYRVNYDEKNWKLLIGVLEDPSRFEQIHPINRAQIVDDAMNLALTGRLDYWIALNVTSYLVHERSYVPWKAGLVALGYIDTMLSKGAYYLEYKSYVLRLVQQAVSELGWSGRADESVVRAQHRVDLVSTACHLEHKACLEHAVRLYTNWMLTPNPDTFNEIEADIRSTVYCVGVQAGGAREWQFAWDRFRAASAPSERELLLSVLGCTRAPHLLYRYLEWSLRNDSGIRKQDSVRVFSAVASSAIGQPIAFSFVRANWDRIKQYVGSVSTLNSIIKVVTKRLNQPHEYEELKKFVTENCSELGRPAQQVLERTAANVQWMQRNYDTIVQWLRNAETPSGAA